MVKTRQRAADAIARVEWKPRQLDAQVEVLRIKDVLPRLARPIERPQFHVVVLFTRGSCSHDIDFERLHCRAGSLILVRPGQVQRWGARRGVDGFILIFEPAFLFSTRPRQGVSREELGFDERSWPAHVKLGDSDFAAAEDWLRRIERCAAEAAGSTLAKPLLRHLLSATLIDLARRLSFSAPLPDVARTRLSEARRLQEDIERSFRVTRTVGDYAMRWSCSERTLDRIAREAFGMSAKQLIDARVVLEARRLLAHTDLTIAAIGEGLGFSEPTNFGKFFEARSGERPGAFRARQR